MFPCFFYDLPHVVAVLRKRWSKWEWPDEKRQETSPGSKLIQKHFVLHVEYHIRNILMNKHHESGDIWICLMIDVYPTSYSYGVSTIPTRHRLWSLRYVNGPLSPPLRKGITFHLEYREWRNVSAYWLVFRTKMNRSMYHIISSYHTTKHYCMIYLHWYEKSRNMIDIQ